MSRVVAIHVTPERGGKTRGVDSARLFARRGIEGDHRCLRTTPKEPRSGVDVTLIEAEALAAAKREYELEISPAECRRNVLTEGVALNHLVGREFKLGSALLRGVELCEPCGHLESLTRKGAVKALIHRGGLRCDVIQDGAVRPGDSITPI